MALIPCVECGRKVSTKAASCPGCGAPISLSIAAAEEAAAAAEEDADEEVDEDESDEFFSLRCAKCRKVFSAPEAQCEAGSSWVCPHCKHEREYEAFGMCPACGKAAGFALQGLGEVLGEIGLSSIGAHLNPLGILSQVGRIFDSIPSGVAVGKCTLCGVVCVVCPNCEVINEFEGDAASTVVVCRECQTEFRHP